MSLPFLSAKTRQPAPTSNLVARPRLLAVLDAFLQPGMQVMLLAAPAGAGKTALLSQWLGPLTADFRVGWLSLDENDSSLARFLAYLFAAIPDLGADFAAQLESNPAVNAEQAVAFLMEQVSDVENNILLVLDDYHVITAPEIHKALKLLIDHQPPNLRLVIAGRVEPPLPLARLRARGQLVEVRAADLRFSLDETGSFFGNFAGLNELSAQANLVKRLNDSTEGWAAGLQMSALALRGEMSRQGGDSAQIEERIFGAMEGSQRYILDYLLEEVLSRESAQIRDFLIKTCLLERFNADLCAALGLEGAQETLTYLERANLFIIPLDGQREWYRYHHLFADVLQKQLLHTRPGLAPDLHRRAANWLEAKGLVDEALNHALQTGNPGLPLDLVEKHALQAILRGQITTATRWLSNLPPEALLTRPRLCLDRAWALTFASQTEAALPYLERAEMLDNTLEARAEIFGLQSYQKSIYGLTAEALRLARLALENSPPDHSFLQCSNRLFLASALVRNGKLDEALKEYRFIQPTCQQQILSGLALLEADFLQFVAMYLNARNQPNRAKALLREAIRTFETTGAGNRKAAALYLYVGLGKILYIENQLTEAERTLEMGLQLEPLSLSLAAIDGWLTLWWVKTGQRDYRAARHILDDLEPAVRDCDEKISRLVRLPGALQDLLEGKIASATTRLERLGFSDQVDEALAQVSDSELMGWRSNEYFVYARVLAARGKSAASLRVLEHMARAAQAFGLDWLLYRTWITQAMVYFQTGQVEVAVDRLAHLLEKTSRLDSGAVQIYLSTGEPARALLKEAQQRGLHPQHVSRLLAEFPPEPSSVKNPDLPEALTERELDVLRLMAAGLKNQEIGAKLYISLNTIRYHTTNLFGKLMVDNRTAAVARASELGIL